MNYGRVSTEELETIEFTLPPDSAFTKQTLAHATRTMPPRVYVGCGKWGRKEWVGNLYPPKTKEADFLSHYIRHFNGIELNATHYKIYGAEVISNWAKQATGTDFKFCPKMAQRITHFTDLVSPNAAALTSEFIDGIRAFGTALGPVFIQVRESFSPAKKDNLYAYLETLPADLQFFIELRHPDWYGNEALSKELLKTLRDSSNGLVITDTAGRRDAIALDLCTPKAFIRFQGYDLHPTDYPRIDEWVKRIKVWLENGLQELYFFMHQPDEKNSPPGCDYVVQQLNKHCGLDLKSPFEKAGQ